MKREGQPASVPRARRRGGRDGPLPALASPTIRARNASPMTFPPKSWSDPATLSGPSAPSPNPSGRAGRKPSISWARSLGRGADERSPDSPTCAPRLTVIVKPKEFGSVANSASRRALRVEGERLRKGVMDRSIAV